MTGKFDTVKVVESRVIYDKHGRRIVEDLLEFADGSRHEWVYFEGSGAVAIAAFTEARATLFSSKDIFETLSGMGWSIHWSI